MRSFIIVACLVCVRAATAKPPAPGYGLADLANSHGDWQQGSAVVDASRDQVRQWLTDYRDWPRHFPDIEWSEVLPDDSAGRHVVRFRSKIADRMIVVHEAIEPGLLVFEGFSPNIHTQGRIHLIPLGDGSTRVVMQSTTEVHGFIGIFATRGLKRDRAFKVTRAHLDALVNLSQGAARAAR